MVFKAIGSRNWQHYMNEWRTTWMIWSTTGSPYLYGWQLEELCCVRKTKKEVVLLITIGLSTTCLETYDRDHSWKYMYEVFAENDALPIKLINGKTIKEVDDEGYKYLGILELDKFKKREMKDIFRTEYLGVSNLSWNLILMARTRSKQQTLGLCRS